MEVCGSETVATTYGSTPEFGWHDQNTNVGFTVENPNPLFVAVNTFWTVDSVFCAITGYDIVKDDGAGGYVAVAANDYAMLVGNNLKIIVDKFTSPTITRYIRAKTASGQFAV